MRKGLVIAVVAACLLGACKDQKMTNVFDTEDDVEEDSVEAFVGDTLHLFEEEAPPVTVDELFSDFFYNFLDDSRFQNQRIVFPLRYHEGEEERKLSKKEWQELDHLQNEEVLSLIYESEHDLELQKDTTINSVAIERFFLHEHYVEKYNFNRLNGKWMLTDVDKHEMAHAPNGDFMRFYAHFATDSVFQREALASMVKVILTSEDGEEEPQEDEIGADDWFEMKENLPLPEEVLMSIDYGQTNNGQHHKTLLLEGISNGMQMKFKFNKMDEEWKLTEIEY